MKIKQQCKLCKKEAPIDKVKSNENWLVYDTSKPCECGGTWEIKIIN